MGNIFREERGRGRVGRGFGVRIGVGEGLRNKTPDSKSF